MPNACKQIMHWYNRGRTQETKILLELRVNIWSQIKDGNYFHLHFTESLRQSYDASNHFLNISRSPLQIRNNKSKNNILHFINIDKRHVQTSYEGISNVT